MGRFLYKIFKSFSRADQGSKLNWQLHVSLVRYIYIYHWEAVRGSRSFLAVEHAQSYENVLLGRNEVLLFRGRRIHTVAIEIYRRYSDSLPCVFAATARSPNSFKGGVKLGMIIPLSA